MPRLNLNADFLRLEYGDEQVEFLPKEFALLTYMWHHLQQTLSREQILDAVWSSENPTDRTVDDHVYRIRRKLNAFHGQVVIETVRGRGYRLKVSTEDTLPEAKSLLQEPDLRENVRQLFLTYYRHGNGQALRSLANNSELYGIQHDPYLEMKAHYVAADFQWLIDHSAEHFAENCFTLLGIYNSIQFNAQQSFKFYQRALDCIAMPEMDKNEIECFVLTQLYAQTGKMEEALLNQERAEKLTIAENWEGYLPGLYLLGAVIATVAGDVALAKVKVRNTEALLTKHPWRRELAQLKIVLGILDLHAGREQEADRKITKGLSIYKQIGFLNHYILVLHGVMWILRLWKNTVSAGFQKKYHQLWDDTVQQFYLRDVESGLYSLLLHHLA